jgi:DNA-binding transcriptional LysR family regulator
VLRVVAGSAFALQRLPAVFLSYHRQYPNIHVRLTMLDREVDLVEEGFDAAILSDAYLKSETLIVRPLTEYINVLVASRGYIDAVGLPEQPEDLERMTFIGRASDQRGRRVMLSRKGAEHPLRLEPVFTANNSMMVHRLLLAGMGFALLPIVMVQDGLDTGELVRLLPSCSVRDTGVRACLAYPSRRYVSRKLRTFIDHVVASFAEHGAEADDSDEAHDTTESNAFIVDSSRPER